MKKDRIEYLFDQIANNVASEQKDIASIRKVFDTIEFTNKTVLEVGCGLGDNLYYCVKKGAKYAEGFDISGDSIKIAQAKYSSMNNIKFHKCAVEEYQTQHKFDIILILGFFEYLENPFYCLKRINNYLNTNGTFILLVSKPIFIKKISILARLIFSALPLKFHLPFAICISKILGIWETAFQKMLYAGESLTYTLNQTVLEGLFVPRYNVFHHKKFVGYLGDNNFTVSKREDIAPSMICLLTEKQTFELRTSTAPTGYGNIYD